MREQARQAFFIDAAWAQARQQQLGKMSGSSAQSVQPYAPRTKKKKRGVYGLKKQTNKKPLCNCWSIIRGKRRRAELHTNAQSLRLTQLHCQDVYCLQHSASGLQCTCSQHKHCSHQGTCKAQQHWPGMAGGQELPKGLANDSMWKSKCTPSMYQNTGIWGSSHAGVDTWLFLAIPARWVLEITSPASCRQGEDTIFTQPLTTLTKINGSKTWGQPSSWFFSLPVTSGTSEAEETKWEEQTSRNWSNNLTWGERSGSACIFFLHPAFSHTEKNSQLEKLTYLQKFFLFFFWKKRLQVPFRFSSLPSSSLVLPRSDTGTIQKGMKAKQKEEVSI